MSKELSEHLTACKKETKQHSERIEFLEELVHELCKVVDQLDVNKKYSGKVLRQRLFHILDRY